MIAAYWITANGVSLRRNWKKPVKSSLTPRKDGESLKTNFYKMANLANIQKLHYCGKKLGNMCTCSNIATRQVKLRKKSEIDKITAEQEWQYRCEEHAKTPTVNKSVFESNEFDQSYALTKINIFLNSLIGKNIVSKAHTARQLNVRYVKLNTGGVMCYQEHSKQWKFVYYHQIESVL